MSRRLFSFHPTHSFDGRKIGLMVTAACIVLSALLLACCFWPPCCLYNACRTEYTRDDAGCGMTINSQNINKSTEMFNCTEYFYLRSTQNGRSARISSLTDALRGHATTEHISHQPLPTKKGRTLPEWSTRSCCLIKPANVYTLLTYAFLCTTVRVSR